MNKKIITFFFMFVISSLYGWTEIQGFAFGEKIAGSLSLTRDLRFPLKGQLGGKVGLFLEFPIAMPASFGLSFHLHGILPSSLSNGFLYRGFSGQDLRVFFSLKTLLFNNPERLELLLGTACGALLSFDRYSFTELYFFYPGAFLEPFLELYLLQLGWATLLISLPIDLYFRKDLILSASAGIGLTLKIYIWKLKPGNQRRSRG